MKRRIIGALAGTALLAAGFALSLSAAGPETEVSVSVPAEEAEETSSVKKIGVIFYSITDEEAMSFRNYLQDYITTCFDDVEFLYSYSITSQEEEMDFIQSAIDEGVQGILSFNSYDLVQEAALCAENEVYYMMASGSISDEVYEQAADNPYFLGVMGPGSKIEYQAGVDMADYFSQQQMGDAYMILSGGASMGNEMHLQRTLGILDTLEAEYQVSFETPTEELAASSSIVHAQAGDLTVCITPGYLDFEEFLTPAREEYAKDQYDVVMSVLPPGDMTNDLAESALGVIDSYTEKNSLLFTEGKLNYLTGKYGSIIGPSFAAMYNAILGYAEDFREDGKAFRIVQGFWSSDNAEDYQKKYILAASLEINAYNYEDLYQLCRCYNPDGEMATLEGLKLMAGAYSYEDVVARRGL